MNNLLGNPVVTIDRWKGPRAAGNVNASRCDHGLRPLHKAEAACTRCPLYAKATQVVSGEGPARARIMLVGEQSGDQESAANI